MGSSTVPRDPQIINLNRLLASQERQILSPTADPTAFKSPYDRARIRANFDYTRSLLLTVSSTKQLPKDDVQRKRELVKRLQARLNELDQLYAHDEDEECESCDEEDQSAQISSTHEQAKEVYGIRQRNSTSTSSQLPSQSQPQATSTSNRYSSALPPTSKQPPNSLQSREQQISSHDSERDDLSKSLLDLAVQLKQSVRGFGAAIEGEKGILDAAVGGLDKSTGAMEGAGGKMKLLSRETEGVGWFKRIRLYLEVAGLWLLVVLLVFVFPKLRF